jgi:hypothetical protein
MLAVVILMDALSTPKFGLLGVLHGCSHVSRGFPKGCPPRFAGCLFPTNTLRTSARISLRVEDLHHDARNVN